MNSKKIIYLVISYIFLFFTIISAKPKIIIEPKFIDAGTIDEMDHFENKFSIKNIGDETLDVTLHATCGCTVLDQNELKILPGNDKIIKFKINFIRNSGKVQKHIFLYSNDPENREIMFYIEALITNKNSNSNEDSSSDTKKLKIINTSQLDHNLVYRDDIIHVFSYKNCISCEKILNELFKWAQDKEQYLIFYYYNLEEYQNKDNLNKILNNLNSTSMSNHDLPIIIKGVNIFSGKKEIKAFIKGKNIVKGKKISDKINILAVFFSGLLDGINPCAFTVIILLISYLTLQLKNSSRILLSGIFYITAVFITYYLIGLGLFEVIRKINAFNIIRIIIKYGLSALLLCLAAVSFYDFIRIKTGNKEKIFLKLPSFLQKAIRINIRNQFKDYKIFIGSIGLGFIVSLFELVCTGQVYLPVITVMARNSNERIKGLSLLLFYNIAFILPLLLIFILVYKGVSQKKIGDYFEMHLALVKILFVFLFITFAVINILA